MKLACEVIEKGTREKNEGNEVSRMSGNEISEGYSDVEEDWNQPEEDEVNLRRPARPVTDMGINC